VTEQAHDRRRQNNDGLRMDRAKRLRELEKDNRRLKKRTAETDRDKAMRREAARPRPRQRPALNL